MKSKTIALVKPVFVIVLISVIAGCASNAQKYSNQPAVAVGSAVKLNFNANLPVDQDRIYIQNQTIVSKAQLDKEQIYCSVFMHGYQDAGQPQMKVIQGEFKVWRVRLYNDFIYEPVIYANNDDSYYSPSYGINFRTELHLKSSEQTDVRALACTDHQLKYQYNNRYPELAQFQAVLGDLVDLP